MLVRCLFTVYLALLIISDAAGSSGRFLGTGSDSNGVLLGLAPDSNLYADLSSVTAATINSLRQAFQLQKLYERDARGGIVTGKQIGRAHV